MSILSPLTHISQNIEVLDRSTPDLSPGDSAEQVSRYLEARDDLDEAEASPASGRLGRLASGALRGVGTGGVIAAGKAIPFAMAGALPWLAVPGIGVAGAGLGLGLGAGYQALQEATRGPRTRKARETIRATPGWIQRVSQDPTLHGAGEAYRAVRRAPWYGAEAGLTGGGLLGAAVGTALGSRVGPMVNPVLGWQPNMTVAQQQAAGTGGLIGAVTGGALGILAGILLKRYRRRQLLDQVIERRGTADV